MNGSAKRTMQRPHDGVGDAEHERRARARRSGPSRVNPDRISLSASSASASSRRTSVRRPSRRTGTLGEFDGAAGDASVTPGGRCVVTRRRPKLVTWPCTSTSRPRPRSPRCWTRAPTPPSPSTCPPARCRRTPRRPGSSSRTSALRRCASSTATPRSRSTSTDLLDDEAFWAYRANEPRGVRHRRLAADVPPPEPPREPWSRSPTASTSSRCCAR